MGTLNYSLLAQHSKLKLQIELVPDGCWFSNVRSNVSARDWDTIRKQVYLEAGYRCEICGGVGAKHPVECHEVWSYDDNIKIQKLELFQALCPPCHEVKHFGFASVRGFRDRALNQFMKINDLNFSTAEAMIDAVFEQWQQRGLVRWELDVCLIDSIYKIKKHDGV